MNWYLVLLGSSVGKKILMAVTGLGMIGFLAVHLLGNMMAFAGADAFNGLRGQTAFAAAISERI